MKTWPRWYWFTCSLFNIYLSLTTSVFIWNHKIIVCRRCSSLLSMALGINQAYIEGDAGGFNNIHSPVWRRRQTPLWLPWWLAASPHGGPHRKCTDLSIFHVTRQHPIRRKHPPPAVDRSYLLYNIYNASLLNMRAAIKLHFRILGKE